ncbi:MarR family winged helix-turn-helix transcriptional regulator [Pseudonocardia acaciae]|uniref:MarR family winged helix-turn-helix transcriptional regulator n=1 Tax=Pseudonocardia acaciae TaxID=551276 RepID=UPI00056B4B0D|nr:MarR family transcriptional regulator [Pseudonocardia acaciae]
MIEIEWLTEDEQRVYRAFSAMSRELFNHFDCDLKADVGIPRTYYELLFVLGSAPEGGMRLTELAHATRSNPSRITYAVARLERDGLLRRTASATDGRAWHAELTEAGAATLQAAARRHARSVREYLLDELGERQREELRRISTKVLARIERIERID